MPASPSSNAYQLLPLGSSSSSIPRFARKKHHSVCPRIPILVLVLVPLSALGYVLYKLALISNAFRTYEADAPVFGEPFRGTGEEVEGRADEFPKWTTTDINSTEVTVWNVKMELANRLTNINLPESSVSCPAIISGRHNSPTHLEARYAHLLPLDENDELSPYMREPQGYYFALNLFNSKAVIPHLFQTLLSVSALLGPSNVHISIFENGSWDETTAAMAHFARALTALGVNHSLRSDPHSTDWSSVDRIEQLAVYRDVAISSLINYSPSNPPLFNEARSHKNSPHPILPTDLIFINDVFVCPTDILELLHQRRFQGASATCGMDWRKAPEGGLWSWLDGWMGANYRFYDNWVTRSMEGWPLRPRVDVFGELRDGVRELFLWDKNTASLNRFRAGLPTPVYSCWNGVIVLNARPFLPSDTIEPTASTYTPPAGKKAGGHSIHFRNGRTSEGECAASECKLVARDFWGVGLKKWVLVPRVAVTYMEYAYGAEYIEERVRRGGVAGMEKDVEEHTFRKVPSEAMEMVEKIEWDKVKDPEKVVCFPFHRGQRLEVWPFYVEGPSFNSSSRHNFNQTAPHIPWEDII